MTLEQLRSALIEIVQRPLIGAGEEYARSINENRNEVTAWANLLHEHWPSPAEIGLPEWVLFIDIAKVAHSYVMDGKRDQHQREYLIAHSILKP